MYLFVAAGVRTADARDFLCNLVWDCSNHDTEMEVLTSVFTPEAGFVGPTTTDPLAQTTLGAWRVLLLNSSVKGAVRRTTGLTRPR